MTRAEYDDAGEEALKLFEYGQVIKLFFLCEKVTVVSVPMSCLVIVDA